MKGRTLHVEGKKIGFGEEESRRWESREEETGANWIENYSDGAMPCEPAVLFPSSYKMSLPCYLWWTPSNCCASGSSEGEYRKIIVCVCVCVLFSCFHISGQWGKAKLKKHFFFNKSMDWLIATYAYLFLTCLILDALK